MNMLVYIYGQVLKEVDHPYVKEVLAVLDEKKIDYKIYGPIANQLPAGLSATVNTFDSYENVRDDKPDYVITLGGDGTILSAMTLIRQMEIPVIGINLGRLGFLASIEKAKISAALEAIFNGECTHSRRSMLSLETNENIFGETSFALNDFAISKRDTSAMVIVHTYINDEFLNSYWADGLIVSTPTGSTGYSLSCGGPIIFPGSGNFVITPIAPHNLNVRPMVIPDSAVLKFKIEGRSDNFLCTLDARFETITSDNEIVIRRTSYDAVMVRLADERFMNTIRSKLHWGLDKRN